MYVRRLKGSLYGRDVPPSHAQEAGHEADAICELQIESVRAVPGLTLRVKTFRWH